LIANNLSELTGGCIPHHPRLASTFGNQTMQRADFFKHSEIHARQFSSREVHPENNSRRLNPSVMFSSDAGNAYRPTQCLKLISTFNSFEV
jgi:hypothetical protein